MFDSLFLGLLGSWHCALMCGGFLWAVRPVPFLTGRLVGYSLVGAALGWGGHWLLGFLGSRLLLGLSGLLLVVMARARFPLAAKKTALLCRASCCASWARGCAARAAGRDFCWVWPRPSFLAGCCRPPGCWLYPKARRLTEP